jgi:hypothetical protein
MVLIQRETHITCTLTIYVHAASITILPRPIIIRSDLGSVPYS